MENEPRGVLPGVRYAYLQSLTDSLAIVETVNMKGEYASEEATKALQEVYRCLECLIREYSSHA